MSLHFNFEPTWTGSIKFERRNISDYKQAFLRKFRGFLLKFFTNPMRAHPDPYRGHGHGTKTGHESLTGPMYCPWHRDRVMSWQLVQVPADWARGA